MATQRPYVFPRQVILAANNSGNISIINSLTLTFRARRWLWKSTGIFNLTGISINTSVQLSDASVSNPINSAFLQQQASPNFNWDRFEIELVVGPQETLQFPVVDTSGAGNTIQLVLIGVMDFP